MKKNVYSLVLMEDVVAEVDRLAYSMNTSRSNMINQILAEYVSYTTPEKRMQEIFGMVESLLTGNQHFQVLFQPSDTMMSLRSALAYKYNPTVRYSVELTRSGHPAIGELRVSLRSQNNGLILYMTQFFKLWTKIEAAYLGHVEAVLEDGRYRRKLYLAEGKERSNAQQGECIASYIQAMDTAMKAYFANLDNPPLAARETEKCYVAYLKKNNTLL